MTDWNRIDDTGGVLLHNPRCSKSRTTLELLRQHAIDPQIIDYQETPPDAAALARIIERLGIHARDLLRSGEDEYKALGLDDHSLSPDHLIRTMVEHPRLIERPIFLYEGHARIGRPPEAVLEIIGGVGLG